jgi:phenylpyruvate tautomerase PptA (4-oxalocrotonate tautomerase family)
MPVVEIRGLPQPGDVVERALTAVTKRVAAVLGKEPRGTWATWEPIGARRYAEGDEVAEAQRDATHPPLLRIVAFEGRSEEQIEAMLTAACDALAAELGLDPGNVFGVYEEARAGRIYTGGHVVRGGS